MTASGPRYGAGKRRTTLLFVGLVAALTACSGSSTDPAGPRLTVVSGGGQSGLEGRVLPDPVVVRVLDPSGGPLVRAPVDVDVAGSGGLEEIRPRSDARGEVRLRWTLGPAAEAQHLEVHVQGGSLVVEATALPESDADRIVVRGGTAPLRGVLVVREVGTRMEIVEEHLEPDRVLLLQPRDRGSEQVVVFPRGAALGWARVSWTPRPDTVEVELRPPVEVDMDVRIYVEPYEEVRAQAIRELALADSAWAAAHFGIRLGAVRFLDRTGEGRVAIGSLESICATPAQERTELSYVHDLDTEAGGLGCPPGQTYVLPETFQRVPNIVTHEIGHTLGLAHAPRGAMGYADGTDFSFTDGEIFRANFDERSGINVLFGGQPQEARRRCLTRKACLDDDYVLGGR